MRNFVLTVVAVTSLTLGAHGEWAPKEITDPFSGVSRPAFELAATQVIGTPGDSRLIYYPDRDMLRWETPLPNFCKGGDWQKVMTYNFGTGAQQELDTVAVEFDDHFFVYAHARQLMDQFNSQDRLVLVYKDECDNKFVALFESSDAIDID
ncbi:MAG: hypothetical protein NXH70_11875 [Hyphomonas sp.]|nr:hypothetical protein [Hyphomonas sp.]